MVKCPVKYICGFGLRFSFILEYLHDHMSTFQFEKGGILVYLDVMQGFQYLQYQDHKGGRPKPATRNVLSLTYRLTTIVAA